MDANRGEKLFSIRYLGRRAKESADERDILNAQITRRARAMWGRLEDVIDACAGLELLQDTFSN